MSYDSRPASIILLLQAKDKPRKAHPEESGPGRQHWLAYKILHVMHSYYLLEEAKVMSPPKKKKKRDDVFASALHCLSFPKSKKYQKERKKTGTTAEE